MKSLLIVFICCFSLLYCCGRVSADNTEKVESAVLAAKQWLQLTDNHQWAESWDETAKLFRNSVSKDTWCAQLEKYRGPLGKIVSRKVLTASYTTLLPNTPKGEYVIIRFRTTFENGKSKTETITPLLEEDNIWRVSGYYIK